MRPSMFMPAALAAVLLAGAGTWWAESGGTTAGHPVVAGIGAGIGASGPSSPTTESAGPSPSITASTSSTPRKSASATPRSTTRSGSSAAGRPQDAPAAAHPAATHHAVPHGPCHSAGYPSGASSLEASIFAMLNQERAANGLCPMTWSPLLQKSAREHSTLMDQKSSAADCSDGNYSHVYPGEPDIDARIFATGYPRGPIAEAIGCSPDPTLRGAESLQTLMYNEKPPANQHREMILSTVVEHVGISIVVDSGDNTLWLTEDYGS